MGLLDDAIREHLDLKRRRGADPAEIERAEREALGPVRREPSMSAGLADEPSPTSTLAEAPPSEFAFAAEVGEFAGESPTTVISPEHEASGGSAATQYAEPDFGDFPAIDPPATPAVELEPGLPVDLESEPIFEPVDEPEAKPKRRHLFGRHRHDGDERPLSADPAEGDSFSDEPGAVSPAQPVGTDQPPAAPQQPPTLRITPDTEPGRTIEYDVEEAFREEDLSEPAENEDILEETPDFLADTPEHDRLWFEQKPPPDFDFDN